MKAQVIMQFGDVSVFETKEVPKPLIKPGYVLVRVMATSVAFRNDTADYASVSCDIAW
jgi:NADPH:quinone reductase-like Zn-dependent oxidoreductase